MQIKKKKKNYKYILHTKYHSINLEFHIFNETKGSIYFFKRGQSMDP